MADSPEVLIEVSFDGEAWLVEATPLPLLAGEACTEVAASVIRCPVSGRPALAYVDGGPSGDRIEIGAGVPSYVSTVLNGEGGTDELLGGPGEDSIVGSIAASNRPVDLLFGRGGEDALANGLRLAGGAGSDLLIAEPCAGQDVRGGGGGDSVSFARVGLGLGVLAEIGGKAV